MSQPILYSHKIEELFKINSVTEFDRLANDIFYFQKHNSKIYQKFLSYISNQDIYTKNKFPFLPISFFKTEKIIADGFNVQEIFTSSSTTGNGVSKHYVADISIYKNAFLKGFNEQFGSPEKYIILGLLPSYLERDGSSLIYMVNHLIEASKRTESGFFLNNFDELANIISVAEIQKQPVILFGVTYALLDFSERYPTPFRYTTIIETGGMKGRKEEITKAELHQKLKTAFNLNNIYSEYGMTELLSQAYSKGDGIYETPPWMKVVITDINDPFCEIGNNQWGRINIIDLANIYSCSFIATDDIGKKTGKNTFELAGRIDFSDMRGCSQLFI